MSRSFRVGNDIKCKCMVIFFQKFSHSACQLLTSFPVPTLRATWCLPYSCSPLPALVSLWSHTTNSTSKFMSNRWGLCIIYPQKKEHQTRLHIQWTVDSHYAHSVRSENVNVFLEMLYICFFPHRVIMSSWTCMLHAFIKVAAIQFHSDQSQWRSTVSFMCYVLQYQMPLAKHANTTIS